MGGAILVDGEIRPISAEAASVIVQNVNDDGKDPVVTPTKINSSVFGSIVPTLDSDQPSTKGIYIHILHNG